MVRKHEKLLGWHQQGWFCAAARPASPSHKPPTAHLDPRIAAVMGFPRRLWVLDDDALFSSVRHLQAKVSRDNSSRGTSVAQPRWQTRRQRSELNSAVPPPHARHPPRSLTSSIFFCRSSALDPYCEHRRPPRLVLSGSSGTMRPNT